MAVPYGLFRGARLQRCYERRGQTCCIRRLNRPAGKLSRDALQIGRDLLASFAMREVRRDLGSSLRREFPV